MEAAHVAAHTLHRMTNQAITSTVTRRRSRTYVDALILFEGGGPTPSATTTITSSGPLPGGESPAGRTPRFDWSRWPDL